MASCSKCSRPIEPGDTFCASCGARTAEAPSALQPEGGAAPLPRPSTLTRSLPPVQQPNYVPPRPVGKPSALARMPATGWLLCGGAAAIALGSLLPWAQVSNAHRNYDFRKPKGWWPGPPYGSRRSSTMDRLAGNPKQIVETALGWFDFGRRCVVHLRGHELVRYWSATEHESRRTDHRRVRSVPIHGWRRGHVGLCGSRLASRSPTTDDGTLGV